LALRVHLDESNLDNGPLRVLPGTHKQGVLSDGEIEELVATTNPVTCVAGRGGIVAMKPLIVHASSKSKSDAPRRVLHIEYAGTTHFGSGLELASV
jgi:ectoine hydroxylase-related dioxygenase (phytanoyl-CoA dioxygenase family)